MRHGGSGRGCAAEVRTRGAADPAQLPKPKTVVQGQQEVASKEQLLHLHSLSAPFYGIATLP